MGIGIDLVPSDLAIKIVMSKIVVTRLNTSIEQSIPSITKQFKFMLRNAIIGSDTYQSIVQGPTLKGELGVVNGASKLEQIIKVWLNSLTIKFKKFDFLGGVSGGDFTVSMIRGDFEDVVGLPAAHHISERAKRDIRWLDWLLTKGTINVVQNFVYTTQFNPSTYKSRTGLGIMKFKRNTGWHVPEPFAGTEADNWITEIILEQGPSFTTIIETEVTKRFYG